MLCAYIYIYIYINKTKKSATINLRNNQIDLIKKYADSVTFIFDEVRDTNNAAQLLRPFMPTYITPPHSIDPADMMEEELNTLITEARSAVLL